MRRVLKRKVSSLARLKIFHRPNKSVFPGSASVELPANSELSDGLWLPSRHLCLPTTCFKSRHGPIYERRRYGTRHQCQHGCIRSTPDEAGTLAPINPESRIHMSIDDCIVFTKRVLLYFDHLNSNRSPRCKCLLLMLKIKHRFCYISFFL